MMTDLKHHGWSYFIALAILATICLVEMKWGRIFAILLNIFFLDPDNDQFGKGKIHRWFYSHSFFPSLWILWSLSEIVARQYWLYIFIAFSGYTLIHLFGDIFTNKGLARIKLYPINKSIDNRLWVIIQIIIYVITIVILSL